MPANNGKNILLLVVSLAVSLVLAEWLLRALVPEPITFLYPQESYELEEVVGFRLVPGQRSFTHDQPVIVNADGVRGREYSADPPKGFYRVIAIGDSQTFGNGLPQHATWPAQLEQAITGKGMAVEVINGGLPATDTWRHVKMARRLLDLYNPDALVLAVYVNDIQVPYGPVGDGKSAMDPNGVRQRFKYWLKRSALVLTAHRALATLTADHEPDKEEKLLSGEWDQQINEAWSVFEQALAEIEALCRQRDVGFMVFSIPRRDQVIGQLPGNAYNQRLYSVTSALGIPYVEVLEQLSRTYQEHGQALFIPWDGHNTALSNRVIASALKDPLASLLLTRP